MSDCILYNATIAIIASDGDTGLMTQAAVIVEHGEICWVGSMADIPATLSETDISHVNCGHRLVTPGLVDCHTHLVYGGDRAMEFEQRLEGVSYEQIAKQGGGIVSTVTATRAASEEELYHSALLRLRRLIDEGVTTVEIKSGYGLDCENEIKMLNVAWQLEQASGIRIKKTFLAAHALPVEFAGRKDEYIDHVCDVMLPAAIHAGVVDAVDGFCEGIAFSVEQIARVFDAAIAVGLPVKLHAEQLSNLGGAVMAAHKGALSVDHIEYLAPDDVPVLAQNGTVAVLLPGAFYTLRETQLPPVQALRDNRVPIAIATDLNPGSSPLNSLLLAMNMACTLFALTPTESLAAVTINAARALGLEQEIGSIETGKRADLVIWDTENPAMLSYQIGANPCAGVMAGGHWIKPPVLS